MNTADIKRNKLTPLIGSSSFMSGIRDIVQAISGNNASVLLVGERGTGKRLIANHIHFAVSNEKKDFIEINCKTFSDEDIKTVYLGIEKFFISEKRITLFINYLDELSPEMQILLLELIKKVNLKGQNLKIVCSTEKDFEQHVSDGLFDKELYYKINTISLNILPLRMRSEDILDMAEYYLTVFGKQSGYGFTSYSDEAKSALENHFWPGNIDELLNSIQRAFIVGKPAVVKVDDLGLARQTVELKHDITSFDLSLKSAVDNFKKEYVAKVLEQVGWNQTKAAKILGIQRTYVIRLINELQIER